MIMIKSSRKNAKNKALLHCNAMEQCLIFEFKIFEPIKFLSLEREIL